jgi:hypothetical protein
MFLQQLPLTRSSTHKLNAAHAAPYVGLGDPPILQPETICCVIDISSIAPIPSPIQRALVCDNSMPINYCDITPHFFSSSYTVLLCIITSNSSPKTCTSSSTGWELSIDHKTHLLPPLGEYFCECISFFHSFGRNFVNNTPRENRRLCTQE